MQTRKVNALHGGVPNFLRTQVLKPAHNRVNRFTPPSPEGQREVTHLLLAGHTNGRFGDDLDGKFLSTLVGHQLDSAVSTSAKGRRGVSWCVNA